MEYIEDNLLLLIASILAIIITLLATQWYSTKNPTHTFHSRKVLHIISVGLCTYVLADSKGDFGIMIIFLSATVFLGLEVFLKRLNISEGESFGIALFPLAFALLSWMGLDYRSICIGGLVLTVSDPLAGWIGKEYGRIKIRPFKEMKSVLGAVVFFVSALVVFYMQPWYPWNLKTMVPISLIAMLAELYSWRGSDNFSIIMMVALMTEFLIVG